MCRMVCGVWCSGLVWCGVLLNKSYQVLFVASLNAFDQVSGGASGERVIERE